MFTFWVSRNLSLKADYACFLRTRRVWVTDGDQYSDYVHRKYLTAKPVGKAST